MRNASCRKSVVLKHDVIPGVFCVPGLRMTFGAYRVGLDTEMVIEHSETPFYTLISIFMHIVAALSEMDGFRQEAAHLVVVAAIPI